MNTLSQTIVNVNLDSIIEQMAIYIHEQAVEIRKDFEIPDGIIKIYSDCIIYPTEDECYSAIHYVVHVDNKTERFFIVAWTPATLDEYLDSIKH